MVILVDRTFASSPIYDTTPDQVGRVEVGADGFTRLHRVFSFELGRQYPAYLI